MSFGGSRPAAKVVRFTWPAPVCIHLHQTLGCRGISRSDFRYDDRRPGTTGLYFLELNSQPGFTPISLVPEQAQRVGISFKDLVTWLVENATCERPRV